MFILDIQEVADGQGLILDVKVLRGSLGVVDEERDVQELLELLGKGDGGLHVSGLDLLDDGLFLREGFGQLGLGEVLALSGLPDELGVVGRDALDGLLLRKGSLRLSLRLRLGGTLNLDDMAEGGAGLADGEHAPFHDGLVELASPSAHLAARHRPKKVIGLFIFNGLLVLSS